MHCSSLPCTSEPDIGLKRTCFSYRDSYRTSWLVDQGEETQRTERQLRMRIILIFLFATFRASSSVLVPPEELYENFNEIKTSQCSKENESELCARLAVIRTDFQCRYGGVGVDRRKCYCCGAVYTYIEQGDICTRFCLTDQKIIPKYGNYPVIILPFNWGDNAKPQSAALADGSSFPIIPVNARLSRKVYGIDTFEEVKTDIQSLTKFKNFPQDENDIFLLSNINSDIGGSVNYLADLMLRSLKSNKKNILFSPLRCPLG